MATTLLFSLSLLFLTFSLSSAACTKADVTALNAVKNSFPPNTFPSSWDGSDNCCSYDGVFCTNSRVTSLVFSSNREGPDALPIVLNGSLPASIGDLSALEDIIIRHQPNLTGPIPDNWANLKSMNYFSIYNTSISGPIPSFFSQYTNLHVIEVNFCMHTGTIPASLGDIATLWSIDFSNNKLTGTVPGTLFSKLKSRHPAYLDLSHNKLTGPIPQPFASVNWQNLDVSYNMLCGQIPSLGSYVPIYGSDGFAQNRCLCGASLSACK